MLHTNNESGLTEVESCPLARGELLMTKIPQRLMILLPLVVASLTIPAQASAYHNQSGASNQDKANACKSLADKKGLQGDDRKSFLQDCLNKAANDTPVSDMSNKDKMKTCKDLADKRNLKGEDRRSFLKDCVNRVVK